MKISREFDEEEMVRYITPDEFRNSGMLWLVNSILHLFGMAIVWDGETDTLKVALVRFRGFAADCNDDGYRKVTQYMVDNSSDLLTDCEQ